MISRAVPEFWALYKQLPPNVQQAARKAHQRFMKNPAHPGLRLERLQSDRRAWSIRVTRDVRAVAFRHGDEWLWFWIGNHKDFDKRFPV